ncbi:MAG: UPF0701 protein YloC [Firmicutes bacterium]|nr:UPF0701 protein YloC [Bacillota bacterium]MDI6705466.1 YicC/YloC family endoribonuclease [Bacillota bacterium]
MICSMTGFGRGEFKSSEAEVSVEIRSVNHRYSDISVKIPKYLSFLEERIREYIQNNISRGRIDVYVSYDQLERKDSEIRVNLELAGNYFNALEQLKAQTGIKDSIPLSLIAAFPDVIVARQSEMDEEKIWSQLSEALEQAVKVLLQMRRKEGENLKLDILEKLETIETGVLEIKNRAQYVVQEYQQRLEKRIEELTKGLDIDKDRLYQEVVVFADRSNIDEELVRLKSHISQMENTLKSGGAVGRKLDFLVQEMYREINTIGSKGNDLEISKRVIDAKTELEKIREQIQNIE